MPAALQNVTPARSTRPQSFLSMTLSRFPPYIVGDEYDPDRGRSTVSPVRDWPEITRQHRASGN